MSGPPVIRSQSAIRDRIVAALSRQHLAVIDLGTSRFSCLLASIQHAMLDRTIFDRNTDVFSALRVIAAADCPAAGMQGGVITDVDAATSALQSLLADIRKQSGITPDRALFALSGGSPRTLQASASSAIPIRMVDDEAVGRVMATCKQEIALRIRSPLHVEPLGFSRDNDKDIPDPRGRYARTLGVRFGIVTVERDALEQIARTARGAGLSVSGVACAPAASGFASLTEDELSLGATVVDIGAAVTGIASFSNNRLRSVHVVPVGGMVLTQDLAQAMQVPFTEAETLKCEHGGAGISADPSLLGGAGSGETTLMLTGVVRPRVEEIFEMVRATLPMGEQRPVILTGGGSKMPGMVEAGSAVLGRRVRLGRPIRSRGAPAQTMGASHAAVHGLLAHAVRQKCEPWADAIKSAASDQQAFSGLRQWLRENW